METKNQIPVFYFQVIWILRILYLSTSAQSISHQFFLNLPPAGVDTYRMVHKPTYKISSDLSKNRLLIELAGTIRKKELSAIYTDIRFSVADLQPGFDVITDLRACRLGYLSGVPDFKKIMQYLVGKEVGTTVRVVGKASLILKQVSRITKGIPGYKPVYVSTLEEAEKRLAEINPPKPS